MSGWNPGEKPTEEDVKRRFITPAIERKWDTHTQIFMERCLTDGRVDVRGGTAGRGKRKKADYVLCHGPDRPAAVVEAKSGGHPLGAGLQQAIEYALMLDAPFAYSSNGTAFIERDMANGTEREIALADFPGPDELWARHIGGKGAAGAQEDAMLAPYDRRGGKEPRYYQQVAINRAVGAVLGGQRRVLLVMATGTGKTYVAFQTVHLLKKAGLAKKVLYLADRNLLVDQAMRNDFKPFGKVMTKISEGRIDTAFEVYFSLYHRLAGEDGAEPFRDIAPEFFDLIIVDECHRGSAADDSQWRRILEYFQGAVQIGMTATPKETRYISNTDYFGPPVYTYSLRQGIEDGFLAPYRVIRVDLDKDVDGWRPRPGQLDVNGREIPDREYGRADFDRNIVMDLRTLLVARRVSEHLRATCRLDKTIVFCEDQEHADRMRRALVNENSDMAAAGKNPNYVVRITSDDEAGKAQLENFTDGAGDCRSPVIATTSDLLTTGVDCRQCKLIVLDCNIGSMTRFKQMIGRGTRLDWDRDKKYFTIMDFRGACRLFADPGFDGEPIPDDAFADGRGKEGGGAGDGGAVRQALDGPSALDQKYRVGDVEFCIARETVQHYGGDGRLVAEGLADFTKKGILGRYRTLDQFIRAWAASDRKRAIVEELGALGVPLEALRAAAGIGGVACIGEMDDFDLICHVAFDGRPLTRAERAAGVKKRDYLSKYGGVARDVLAALLDKYAQNGIDDLENPDVLTIEPLRSIAPPKAIMEAFGGRDAFLAALKEMEAWIYGAA